MLLHCSVFFFFQAEDGIRDLVRSRGLGDVYKRQAVDGDGLLAEVAQVGHIVERHVDHRAGGDGHHLGRGLSLIHI